MAQLNLADPTAWPNQRAYDLYMAEAAKMAADARDEYSAEDEGPPEYNLSFEDHIGDVFPQYFWESHNKLVVDHLEEVAAGRLRNLIITLPPRHGKSETTSRLFPSYFLRKHPEKWVGITAYGANLANGFSRKARQYYQKSGGQMSKEAFAVTEWETLYGGGLWTGGVGSGIVGKGFHVGIIDDSIKNAEEAASVVIAERNREWYDSTWSNRGEPDAAEILVGTRWPGRADIIGYALEKELQEDEAVNWTVIHLPALAMPRQEVLDFYPPNVKVAADWRKIGEALSKRYPLKALNRIMKRMGSYWADSLYQQTPRPREGGFFEYGSIEIVEDFPKSNPRFVRYWDKAGTKDGGKETAGLLLCYTKGVFYILDVITGQWAATKREEKIRNTAILDNARFEQYGGVVTVVEQEPGSGGKESAENSIGVTLRGFRARVDKVTGSKTLRAEAVAAQAGIGNLKMVAAPWNDKVADAIYGFPLAAFKDIVDALSGAFNALNKRIMDLGDLDDLGTVEDYTNPWD